MFVQHPDHVALRDSQESRPHDASPFPPSPPPPPPPPSPPGARRHPRGFEERGHVKGRRRRGGRESLGRHVGRSSHESRRCTQANRCRRGASERVPVCLIEQEIAAPRTQSCRTTLKSALSTVSVPLYLMNPSFRNLFMKTLTRDRVVPTISASVSCEIFGSTRPGVGSSP